MLSACGMLRGVFFQQVIQHSPVAAPGNVNSFFLEADFADHLVPLVIESHGGAFHVTVRFYYPISRYLLALRGQGAQHQHAGEQCNI